MIFQLSEKEKNEVITNCDNLSRIKSDFFYVRSVPTLLAASTRSCPMT
jgi:hypothetical protein